MTGGTPRSSAATTIGYTSSAWWKTLFEYRSGSDAGVVKHAAATTGARFAGAATRRGGRGAAGRLRGLGDRAAYLLQSTSGIASALSAPQLPNISPAARDSTSRCEDLSRKLDEV